MSPVSPLSNLICHWQREKYHIVFAMYKFGCHIDFTFCLFLICYFEYCNKDVIHFFTNMWNMKRYMYNKSSNKEIMFSFENMYSRLYLVEKYIHFWDLLHSNTVCKNFLCCQAVHTSIHTSILYAWIHNESTYLFNIIW